VESGEVVRVVAAVIEIDGRILVAQRPAHRNGGLWEFPRGKVNPSEDSLAAARRELAEELGVEVTAVGCVLCAYPDPGSTFIIEFTPTRIAGEPAPREHQALAWVTPEELAQLPMAPSDRRFAVAGRHVVS
jgi:8-oxo-dGTP pyrophosphatase MutT (NUDIX family)